MTSNIDLRPCIACGKPYPPTVEYFYRRSKSPLGIGPRCRNCERQKAKDRYNANPERQKKNSQKYYERHADHVKERVRNYRQANVAKIRITAKDYRVRNPQRAKQWRIRQWHRRKELKTTLSPSDWKFALEYFANSCAYCGEQSDRLVADHYIPVSHPKCPGTTRQNIVPTCKKCNCSKEALMPAKWLKRRYGERKARETLKRIHKYFSLVTAPDASETVGEQPNQLELFD